LFIAPAFGSLRSRVYRAFRSTIVYAVIAVVYLVFVVGYLKVQGFEITKLFEKPETVAGGYYLVLGDNVIQNADLAASWAFNMPRGWHGGFRHIPTELVTVLRLFRAVAVGLFVFLLLVKVQRRILVFAVIWFFLTVLPALPLVNHFLPYYLFLPLAGLSVLIGSAFGWATDRLMRLHWAVAASMITVVFVGLLVACSASIHADIENHRLLGGSAAIASQSLRDLMDLYPVLPP